MPHSHQRKVRLTLTVLGILLAGLVAGVMTGGGPAAYLTGGSVTLLLGLGLLGWIAWRRQREQREAIRNFAEVMEQSHSAIMIMDPDQRIEYVNGGCCAQFGYSRRELIGRSWRKFQAAETPPEALADLAASLRTVHSWTGEWFHRRKDGNVYPVRGVVSPVKRRDGTLASYVAVFEDTTEQKRRDAELQEAKERAEAGGRAKSQFLATMSHEVRTPLNGIVGFATLLLDMPLTAEQREHVQTIRSSAATLVDLTGDIIDFARIESDRLVLDPVPCDLRACVEDALDLSAGFAVEKQLELLHWIDDDVPPVVIADTGRLRQALANLVHNGVKFTRAGKVEVRVKVGAPEAGQAGPAPDDVALEFSVTDTGIGIAPEHHPLLFKPFSQLDATMTRRFGGTGLGLVISKTLVERMGGRLSFISEPGTGSTFTFMIRFPVYHEESQIRTASSSARPLTGYRLALATHAAGLRGEMMRLLTHWGAEVIETEHSMLAFTAFDLALVDVDAGLGEQLASTRPSPKRLSSQKLFGLVDFSLPTAARQDLRAHFRLLVNKPVHHTALLTLLINALPAQPGTRTPFIRPEKEADRTASAFDPVDAATTSPVPASPEAKETPGA